MDRLTLHTDRSDLARAFMEGVGFEIRRCIEVLAETDTVAEIVLAGHLAAILGVASTADGDRFNRGNKRQSGLLHNT